MDTSDPPLDRQPEDQVDRLEAQRQNQHDLEIIENNADRLNREAIDVLGYQQMP